eukprot:350324-Chlamydomonas_euryale.AAC.4
MSHVRHGVNLLCNGTGQQAQPPDGLGPPWVPNLSSTAAQQQHSITAASPPFYRQDLPWAPNLSSTAVSPPRWGPARRTSTCQLAPQARAVSRRPAWRAPPVSVTIALECLGAPPSILQHRYGLRAGSGNAHCATVSRGS